MKKKLPCILIVDDDSADVFFHKRAISKLDCTEEIREFFSPVEALDYLQNTDDENYIRPNLIFLDINMPMLNGWEFLDRYNQMEAYKQGDVVCVMLSTSFNPRDIERSKQYDTVREYIAKPLKKDKLQAVLDRFFPEFA